jgi:hypothetical protein
MMIDISRMVLDGLILSALASAFIIITMRLKPRVWLQDYPEDIQAQVPPKTEQEKRLSLVLGIPFLLLLIAVPLISTLMLEARHPQTATFFALAANGFGVAFVFNVVDWLILDWLMFCTVTPRFIVIPGSEGAAGYKNYGYHFRGFLIGTVFSLVVGLIVGGVVWLI